MTEQVRFLAGVIAVGFVGVSATLAVLFNGGTAAFAGAALPLIGFYLISREELPTAGEQRREIEYTSGAATDGGREVDA